MNLKYNYWYWLQALPYHICDEIIKYGLECNKVQMGVTGGFDANKVTPRDISLIKQKRDSNVAWLDDTWIYREILPFVKAANRKANWNFDLAQAEQCQFTIYGPQQHYGWHCDSWEEPYQENSKVKGFKGLVRKLSITVSLSDETDYEGGELEIDHKNCVEKRQIETITKIKPRGSIIVFPSFMWHRVKPVFKGLRYSLVLWVCGKPFR